MDVSKPTPPTSANALAGVAQAQAAAPSPAAKAAKTFPAPRPPATSTNPQARHPEDRVRNYASGANPKPTKAFAGRSSAPASSNTSGMERAMGALADRMHAPKRRR